MTADRTFAGYRRQQIALSAAISAAFSAFFFVVAFGFSGAIPMHGVNNFAFDTIPQAAGVTLMGSLMPGLAFRKLLRGSGLGNEPCSPPSPRTFAMIVVACVTAAVLTGAALFGVASIAGPDHIDHGPALLLKMAFGAALGAITTACSLTLLFRAARFQP